MGGIELFMRGGIMMYAIALASLAAMTIFIERLIALRRNKIIPKSLQTRIHSLTLESKAEQAAILCNNDPSPLAAIYRHILSKKAEPDYIIKEKVEEVGRQQSARFERFIPSLGTIASVAPLMGILGTVLGMIVAFQRVTQIGHASPTHMASGVWQALITSAFGLAVGILAMVAHRYLVGHIDRLTLALEKEATGLIDLVQIADRAE